MLKNLLKNSSWEEFSDYLSPEFFNVVSPLDLFAIARRLTQSYVSQQGFEDVKLSVESIITSHALPIKLVKTDESPTDQIFFDPNTRGAMILRLYFAQLMQAPAGILDFRHASFSSKNKDLIWEPKPLYITWNQKFIESIRQLYVGFYLEKNELFDTALAQLNLTCAKDVLIKHFGDNQSSVKFDLDQFRRTFHDVFVKAKESKSKINAEFFAFGISLTCLYEHLSTLKTDFDVRQAFLATYDRISS